SAAHLSLAQSKVRPAHIAALVKLVDAGTVLTNAAKEIFIEMAATGDQPDAIADRKGLKATPTDSNELEQWCRDSIAANPKAVTEFKAGKESALNAFKGPIMKAAKGKANPKLVDETLRKLLAAM
ncbi:MAG: Asp-tRNA(Asn)/Glu-tRNA(Gln) amidotransferase GatCAB subunit B, partial [Verrucomicrobia bacterium]|nr:Asp-tRNA(Asn)/Glu-tRNA(Gln) amidotransferase GatCAB subunit B [Verrucomicrobiota bacterium]